MVKKSSIWLLVLISIVAIGVISSGCSKKQMVKEETAGKPPMVAKKVEPLSGAEDGAAQGTAAPCSCTKGRSQTSAQGGGSRACSFRLNRMRIQFAFR